jgi:hypothetical protein
MTTERYRTNLGTRPPIRARRQRALLVGIGLAIELLLLSKPGDIVARDGQYVDRLGGPDVIADSDGWIVDVPEDIRLAEVDAAAASTTGGWTCQVPHDAASAETGDLDVYED